MSGSRVLLCFCLLAAIRVWLYAAAFPFFNNVDEIAHLDLVIKYSQGEIPTKLETMSDQTVKLVVTYMSPEYITTPETYKGKGMPRPRWKQWNGQINKGDSALINYLLQLPNHEASSAPLYYVMAGAWLTFGSAIMTWAVEGHQMYWIRFLNVIFAVLLVWLAYRCAEEIPGTNRHAVWAVTGLAALMPQDAFYAVQSDVLSPVCFGFAFLFLIRFVRADVPPGRLGLFLGIAVASTVLVKTSNLPLILLMTAMVIFKAYRLKKQQQLRAARPALLKFFLFAWIPLFCWMTWNYQVFGDVFASEEKIRHLGWTHKPLSDWLDNSMLTFERTGLFWREIMVTFWRGELIFHLKRVAFPVLDVLFWLSSLIFLVLALVTRGIISDGLLRMATRWSFVLLIVYIIVLSLMFDYGSCGYPSRLMPFFSSGRLLWGALIPFTLLYVGGYNFLFSWIGNPNVRYLLFWLILISVTITEAMISIPVFESRYNFFHM